MVPGGHIPQKVTDQAVHLFLHGWDVDVADTTTGWRLHASHPAGGTTDLAWEDSNSRNVRQKLVALHLPGAVDGRISLKDWRVAVTKPTRGRNGMCRCCTGTPDPRVGLTSAGLCHGCASTHRTLTAWKIDSQHCGERLHGGGWRAGEQSDPTKWANLHTLRSALSDAAPAVTVIDGYTPVVVVPAAHNSEVRWRWDNRWIAEHGLVNHDNRFVPSQVLHTIDTPITVYELADRIRESVLEASNLPALTAPVPLLRSVPHVRRFGVCPNPDRSSSHPYLLRVPCYPHGDWILKSTVPWPTDRQAHCYPYDGPIPPGEEWDLSPVISCTWEHAHLELVIDRPARRRAVFWFGRRAGQPDVYWATQVTGDRRTPSAFDAERPVIMVDTREKEPYRFEASPVATVRKALPYGDYAVRDTHGNIIGAVERKTGDEYVSCLFDDRMFWQMIELKAAPSALIVVEDTHDVLTRSRFATGGAARDRHTRLLAAGHHVTVDFCGDRAEAERTTSFFLSNVLAAWYAAQRSEDFPFRIEPPLPTQVA